MKKSAFTLVELLVIVTIIMIIAAIGFVSYKSYALSARDAKRQADVSAIIEKLTIEIASANFRNMSDMLKDKSNNDVIINNEDKKSTQGILDFPLVGEKRENFIDPLYAKDYEFATISSSTIIDGIRIPYHFVEARHRCEKEEEAKISGNYIKYLEDDSHTLFSGSLVMDN